MRSPPPSVRVVEAVARKEGVSSTRLSRPLYDVLDADALDALFSCSSPLDTSPLEVTFEYLGYDVSVVGNDATDVTVRVRETSPAGSRSASGQDLESGEYCC